MNIVSETQKTHNVRGSGFRNKKKKKKKKKKPKAKKQK